MRNFIFIAISSLLCALFYTKFSGLSFIFTMPLALMVLIGAIIKARGHPQQ